MMQLMELRAKRQLPNSVEIPWTRIKVLEVSPKDREVRDFEAVALASGAVVDPESEAAFTIVAATMGVDAKGQLAERVRQCGMMADLILLEGPLVSSWEVFNNAELFDQWGKWEMEFVTTELGEATARRRRMMIMMKGAEDASLQVVEDYLTKTPVASPMASCIRPAGAEGLTWEFPMRLQICPGIPRDPLLPAVVAHGWWAEESERVNIYGLGGPARWPLMDKTNGQMERIFVYDLKGPVGAVRTLTPWELWRCQGRDSTSWAQARDNGVGEEDLLRQGCRGTGRRTAQSLLFAAAKVVNEHVREQSAHEGRAGAVRDGPEDESLAKLLLWLRKWRTGEFGRGLISRRAGGVGAETLAGMKENAQVVWRWGESLWLEALEELEEFDLGDRRAGGRRSSKKVEQCLGNSHLDDSGERRLPFDGSVGVRVEEWIEENMDGDKADSTKKVYQSAWHKWETWARRQGWPTPYLDPKADKLDSENRLLGFLGYLGWLGRSAATLKQCLFAIKDRHKRMGAGDPTLGMFRVWLLVNSVDRLGPKKPRRLGVTPGMMKWINKTFDGKNEDRNEAGFDQAVLCAALTTAWFFMLRAKEFCDSSGVDREMVVRGADVMLTYEGEPAAQGQANEITLQFRKTKADQEAFGSCKTYKATDVEGLCPVKSMERLRHFAPRRFDDGPEALEPLFRWANGVTLKRTEVQVVLKKAARALGLPEDRMMPHSLRVGGPVRFFKRLAR